MADLTRSERCIEDIRKAADRVCSETYKLRDSMIARVRCQIESENSICNGDSRTGVEVSGSDSSGLLFFQPGDIDTQKIQEILGRLEAEGDPVKNAQLWKMSSLRNNTRSVDVLMSTSEERAWLCDDHMNLCLVDIYGKTVVKRKINHIPETIAISDSGDIYYSSYREMAVKKLDVSGKVGYVLNTSPLHPLGLCLTNGGSLLVCVVDKFDFVTGKDKPKDILKVELDSGVVTSVKFKDEDEMLTGPYRILENINGDIILVDGLSETAGRLVVFNDIGGVKFTYHGENSENGDIFCPTNMCIDYKGNIFVVDGESHCIHVLNSSGKLQRKIAPDEIGGSEATVLSIGRDELMWVGHANGEVTVFRYGRSKRVMSRKLNEKETFF
ncbi:uncharacterized protein LOC117335243 [Pecten maximus]|uniref:uncharacterized protein LOC117335243 n=1 Tax=Pecten maximus TaxID=6579 RepID=UPI0014586262|nr:uncharacterized protein LOC117335243 [Pecten maximus]